MLTTMTEEGDLDDCFEGIQRHLAFPHGAATSGRNDRRTFLVKPCSISWVHNITSASSAGKASFGHWNSPSGSGSGA